MEGKEVKKNGRKSEEGRKGGKEFHTRKGVITQSR